MEAVFISCLVLQLCLRSTADSEQGNKLIVRFILYYHVTPHLKVILKVINS